MTCRALSTRLTVAVGTAGRFGRGTVPLGGSRPARAAHIGALCGCVLLAACDSSAFSPDRINGFVEVRVVDRASQGVAGAKIEAKNFCCAPVTALTGIDGTVTLQLLHQDDYDITLTPPDGFSVASNQTNPIHVVATNERTTRLTFTVQRGP